uniref:hypoxia-inducible factor-proline dioxygenase n=1 Tax=Elaeophora elaphi TaxID=1147741 RepID=A0A158Q8L7_9BILA
MARKDMFLQNFDWKRHKPLCKTVQSHLARTAAAATAVEQRSANKLVNSVGHTTVADVKWLGTSVCVLFDKLKNKFHSIELKKFLAPKNNAGAIPPPSDRFCENSVNTSDTDNRVLKKIVNTSEKVSRKRLLQMNCRHSQLIDHSANPIFAISLQDHLKVLAASGSAVHQQQAVGLHLKCIADHAVKCLNDYGWAIVDNFLGQNYSCHIHREMNYLYNRGVFKPGQLMETRVNSNSQNIRSDEVYWFDSSDERVRVAVTVRLLVAMIDSIIVHFNGRIPYEINGRSRAMLAIYPSNGTHYVKHIDNPMKDGRCITAIYYCNHNWNVERDGGCFRLFPETSDVPVDIEPRADRLLLLWSDRRNPHEVRPVYRDRYAITVWYFDANEKLEAMAKKRKQNVVDEKIDDKQELQQSILFSNEQKLQQPLLSPLNSFAKREPDILSSHDNLPNHFNIFHPTVPSTQQSLRTAFGTEQIMKHGNGILCHFACFLYHFELHVFSMNYVHELKTVDTFLLKCLK